MNEIENVISNIEKKIEKCKSAMENGSEFNGHKASQIDLDYLQDQLEDAIQLKKYMKE